MKKGRCGTMTHDYKRHGTTTLFAALEVLQGRVIGQCYERHRHQEFLKFLRRLDEEFPGDIPLHLVMDNYGTHKHPQDGGVAQPTLSLHLSLCATSSSWLNLIERWFGELTSKRVRRGSFFSVDDLQRAITDFLNAGMRNRNPLSGRPLSNPFKPNSLAAARPWSRSNPDVRTANKKEAE